MRALKWLAVLTAVGMFFVVTGGALVTQTDSGLGCGKEWPLCNGKLVPDLTLESLIEYSHRAVSGIVGILVVLLAILVFRKLKDAREAKTYAVIALFFTSLQAILGALAVIWRQSSAVLALHFGFSLLAFAGSLLLAIRVWQLVTPTTRLPAYDRAISVGLRNFVWLIAGYTYIVIYFGAYVRHTNSMGGCMGWPLCNGEVIPQLSGATGVVFVHRLAAAILFVLILCMYIITRTRYKANRELTVAASFVMLLVLMQVLSGAWVTFSITNDQVHIFATLLHTSIITGFFGALCYLVALVSLNGRALAEKIQGKGGSCD
ncbi:MAG TPA: heme A synthase [Bacilli bacterium]